MPTVVNMKDCGRMVKSTDRVRKLMRMVLNMKVNIRMISLMAPENTPGNKTNSMKANGDTVSSMERASGSYLMDRGTAVSGEMGCHTVVAS